jgi:DNA replication initiation complex subunit (GINS family)
MNKLYNRLRSRIRGLEAEKRHIEKCVSHDGGRDMPVYANSNTLDNIEREIKRLTNIRIKKEDV